MLNFNWRDSTQKYVAWTIVGKDITNMSCVRTTWTNVTPRDVYWTIGDRTIVTNAYGWNSPGRESLLDKCHKNFCTLGLLTRIFLHLVRN